MKTAALDAIQTLTSRACSFTPSDTSRSSCGSPTGMPPSKGQQTPFCMLCIHCPKCADKASGVAVSCELCQACHVCSLRGTGGCGK